MKTNTFLVRIIFFLFLLSACKKEGQVITDPSFGRLNISGLLSSPLILKIDGEIVDTLQPGGEFTRPVAEGSHNILLSDSTNKSLIDTTLTFEKQKTRYLSDFYYTGSGILVPDADTTRKPSPGKMLIRFIITDKSLPDELNLELFIMNFSSGVLTPTNIKINDVKKDQFSNYIEIDNPGSSDDYYLLEGYDLMGNKKMSIDDVTYGFIISDNNFSSFTANSIISLGIGPDNENDPSHQPVIIFSRIAK